jgi:O-antigen/teichoic acid export membrane protein
MKIDSGKELLKGSFILLVLFNAFNLLNLIFQIFTARALSLAEYGTLTALLSIIYLFAIFSESIQLTVAKQSANAKSSGEIKGIYDYAFRQCRSASLVIFIIYIILFAILQGSLKIAFPLLLFNGLTVFFAFLTPITRGILQGKKMFLSLGWSMTLEGLVKVIASALLIAIGWSVYGAMVGIILSMAVPLIYARYSQLKEYLAPKNIQSKKKFSLLQYGTNVFVIMTCFILFFMLDTFIAKIVFDPNTAGMYAIIATLAKTLFIGTQPISKAFFPLAASEKKGSSGALFKKAMTYVAICLIIALIVFFFLSDFIVTLFSGKSLGTAGKSLGTAAHALFIVGLANAVLAFVNLLLFYRISQENYKNMFLFGICVIIQVFLLFMFHNSIYQFALAFLASTVIFLAAALYRLR